MSYAPSPFEVDPVQVKPGAPESSPDPINVPLQTAAKVVATCSLNDALDVEVDHADDAIGAKKRGCGVYRDMKVRQHAEAVRHGDQASLALVEVEEPGILTHNVHVLPPEAREPATRNFTERRREVYEIDGGEELLDIDKTRHRLDIPARAAANVHPDGLRRTYSLFVFGLVLELGSGQGEHLLAAAQKSAPSDIVDISLDDGQYAVGHVLQSADLGLVKTLKSTLLAS